jgi:hypothetical protein
MAERGHRHALDRVIHGAEGAQGSEPVVRDHRIAEVIRLDGNERLAA